MFPRACAAQAKPPQQAAQELQLESSPHSPQLDKSLHSNKDPARPKVNNFFLIELLAGGEVI